jgi:hypothetical protein
MSDIYCGNNMLNKDLINGTKQMGSRFVCYRKGVGVGLKMPYDPSYEGEYIPINNEKVYCGNSDVLPENYDRMGSLSNCLQRGVGVGKSMRVERGLGMSDYISKYYVRIFKILSVIMMLVLTTVLILRLTNVIKVGDSDKDDKDGKYDNWVLFLEYTIAMVILGIIMFM